MIQPKIPIGNVIDTASVSEYLYYVQNLNGAIDKDTAAFHRFLAINTPQNGNGYTHGAIIVDVFQIVGDDFAAANIKKLNTNELETLKSYMSVGVTSGSPEKEKLLSNCPKTLEYLGFRQAENNGLGL
jgi:hypothetical protein